MYQIVIADDETSIRNGIACLIDWKALDCEIAGSCSNGAQVLELVKNQDIQIVKED